MLKPPHVEIGQTLEEISATYEKYHELITTKITDFARIAEDDDETKELRNMYAHLGVGVVEAKKLGNVIVFRAAVNVMIQFDRVVTRKLAGATFARAHVGQTEIDRVRRERPLADKGVLDELTIPVGMEFNREPDLYRNTGMEMKMTPVLQMDIEKLIEQLISIVPVLNFVGFKLSPKEIRQIMTDTKPGCTYYVMEYIDGEGKLVKEEATADPMYTLAKTFERAAKTASVGIKVVCIKEDIVL